MYRSYSTELRSGQDNCRETLKGPTINESTGDYISEHEILGSDGLCEVGECILFIILLPLNVMKRQITLQVYLFNSKMLYFSGQRVSKGQVLINRVREKISGNSVVVEEIPIRYSLLADAKLTF